MRLTTLVPLALATAILAGAAPITYTFSGTATGTAGAAPFSNAAFLFTFTSNTTNIVTPSCCTEDLSTPSATPATVYIQGIGSGNLIDTQAVFVNPSTAEENIGIWHDNEPDWLDVVTSAATTYSLATSLGPITANAFSSVAMGGEALDSSLGALSFSAVSNVTFTASVGLSPASDPATPEPSTMVLLGTGIVGLLVGRYRRLR